MVKVESLRPQKVKSVKQKRTEGVLHCNFQRFVLQNTSTKRFVLFCKVQVQKTVQDHVQ